MVQNRTIGQVLACTDPKGPIDERRALGRNGADPDVILFRVSEPGRDRDLIAEEDRLWAELHDLVDSLPQDKVAEPGYFSEGWSAKDLVAHIGSWLAEAGVVLERIRFNTYRPEEIDIDAMNKTFYDSMHDVSFPDVRAQAVTARNRMLRAWRSLPETSPEADRWISKSGPEHYVEHLPRLKEWVDQLQAQDQ